jgi:hypothetical protein
MYSLEGIYILWPEMRKLKVCRAPTCNLRAVLKSSSS